MGIAEILRLRPTGESRAASALYAAIVQQARDPAFFTSLGVPDSVDGRFETLGLHAFLVLHRFKVERSDAAARMSRTLLEIFVADMDRSLREMGAADLGVGRRVKAMAQALYGRIKAYEDGLGERGDAALEVALRRNLYGTLREVRPADLAAVAAYVRRQHAALAAQPFPELQAGRIQFAPVGSSPRLEASS